jgi:hypothetical protein
MTSTRARTTDAAGPAAGSAPGGRAPASPPSVNLAVLRGPCSGPPELRVLESGTRVATLAVRIPVTVWDPPAWVEDLDAGDEVVVAGRMRRRFYQRAGGVGARVDVEAELVGRARDRRRVDAASRRAQDVLDLLA